jgi:NAD(P)-dependent dehydrogenase (short-subunit alcohol dehydrogenase family)
MNKKIGVVTGSNKGIGKAIAIAFAKSGEYFAVVTNARKLQEAQTVSDEIRTLGCDSIPIEADISKEADCIRLIEETINDGSMAENLGCGSYRTFHMQQRSCKTYGETTGSNRRLHHKYNICPPIDTQTTLYSICNFQSRR